MIKRVIKSHDKNLNETKKQGPEKFLTVLKLQYIKDTSHVFKNMVTGQNCTKTNLHEDNFALSTALHK